MPKFFVINYQNETIFMYFIYECNKNLTMAIVII